MSDYRPDLELIADYERGVAGARAEIGRMAMTIASRVSSSFDLLAVDRREMINTAALRIIAKLHLYSGDSKLSTWMFSVALNSARMFLRNSGYRRTRKMLGVEGCEAEEAADEIALARGTCRTPEQEFIHRENLERLRAAMDEAATTPDLRYMMERRYVDDVALIQIASELGVVEPTIRTKLFRVRATIRAMLAEDGDEQPESKKIA